MNLFVLEDDPARRALLGEQLEEGDRVVWVETCADFHRFKPPYDLILLDHDLGGRQLEDHEDSGTRFAELMVAGGFKGGAVVVHSFNPVGALRMMQILRTHCDALRYVPFGGDLFTTIKGFRVLQQAQKEITQWKQKTPR